MTIPKKLLILGAGYTGQRLATRAHELGYEVTGTSRDEQTLSWLREQGMGAQRFDLLTDDYEALLGPLMDANTVLVYSAPTIFGQYQTPTQDEPAHVGPMRKLQAVARKRGLARLIYLSSTSVYGDHDGAWVDERTRVQPSSDLGKMRRDIEREALRFAPHAPVNVARIVGIYGPGRTLLDYIRRGRYTLVDGGYKRTNRVHVEDIVASILAMIERAPAHGGRIYNVADGQPLMVRELVSFLFERLKMPWPPEEALEDYARRAGPNAAARWESEYLCQNDRLTGELGLSLAHPDAIKGYEAMIAREELALEASE